MAWKAPKIVEVQVGMEINSVRLRGAQVASITPVSRAPVLEAAWSLVRRPGARVARRWS